MRHRTLLPSRSLVFVAGVLATALGAGPGCTAKDAADGGVVADDAGDGGTGTTTFMPADDGNDNPSISDSGAGPGGTGPGMTSMTSGLDSGDGFIQPPDGGVTGQCDPAAQDCPEGEKCTSYVSMPGAETVDATKCVPSTGTAVAGEACIREMDTDDCDAGFFCMTDVSGHTGDGFCLEYCDVMTMQCEFGGECFAFNDGALPVCQVTCDPLLQDCTAGQGCYAAFENFVCAVPGHPDGGGGDGDDCATVQGCQPGLLCRTGTNGCTEGAGCCTPVCALSNGGSECTDGAEECIAALDNPPPGLADAGFCGVPA